MTLNTTVDAIIESLFDNSLIPGLTLTQDATYNAVTAGTFNISTGAYTPSTSSTSIKLIDAEFLKGEIAGSNGQVLTEDSLFYVRPVSGVTLDAMKDDTITLGSKVYRVKEVERKALGSTRLCFIIRAEAMS